MDLNMSSLAHAYPRCGTLCDMIILCTADFNLYAPTHPVHQGDMKCAVDEMNMRSGLTDQKLVSTSTHAYPRCGTLCDMIILCTADFN